MSYEYLSLTPSKMGSSMNIISLLLVQLVYRNAGIIVCAIKVYNPRNVGVLCIELLDYPSNITLLIGSEREAVFRCQHQSADTIGWRVNGSPTRLFPDIRASAIAENGAIVYTLSIPARSEYDGTEVECVALFTDGSLTEIPPPVILTITAGLLHCHPEDPS